MPKYQTRDIVAHQEARSELAGDRARVARAVAQLDSLPILTDSCKNLDTYISSSARKIENADKLNHFEADPCMNERDAEVMTSPNTCMYASNSLFFLVSSQYYSHATSWVNFALFSSQFRIFSKILLQFALSSVSKFGCPKLGELLITPFLDI